MNSDHLGSGSGPQSWAALHAEVVAAAQANLEQAIRAAKAIEILVPAIPWDPEADRISLLVGSPRGVYWKEAQFFLIDDALDEQRQENRHVVEYHFYNTGTGLLGLKIPAAAREGLRGAVKVRGFRVDEDQVDLAQHWNDTVRKMDRGPRALELWSGGTTVLTPWSPGHLPEDRALNSGQQAALAAMTTPGGFFVWGPPGTGKTTVIASAVHRALAEERSVLVASHTNVAVDNVLTGLVDDDAKYELGIMRPGQVIRHSGSSTGKVSPAVQSHPSLLLDKAAALVTGLQTKLKQLDDELRLNLDHPIRAREADALEELNRLDVDVAAVREARELESGLIESEQLQSRLATLHEEIAANGHSIAECESEAERFAALDAEISSFQRERVALQEALQAWIVEREECEAASSRSAHEVDAALARRQAADLRLNSGMAKVLPAVANRRRIASAEAAAAVFDLLAARERIVAAWQRAQAAQQGIEGELRAQEFREAELTRRSAEREGVRERIEHLRRAGHRLNGDAETLRVRQAELGEVLGDIETRSEASRRMRERGHWRLVGEYDELLLRVEVLDEEQQGLDNRRKQLQDEFEETRRELLRSAPVIATTLTALSFSPELRSRRFDVVIIDEAASAEAVPLLYAAAKADATLAVVGDFLQNAPITEAEDATDDEQRETARWRTEDIFALAGVVDRGSAERHPRCVALSMQYRYPPIIADVVNDFCYDGLLESHRRDNPEGGATITFFDTSEIPAMELSRVAGSWCCDRTAEFAADLAAREIAAGSAAASIGYVTPYAPQANAVQRAFRGRGLEIEAGTSHRFQGREFDTVIFDLMQDGSPRWVAAADLYGNRRAVSAAKLLNVALTRAKKKLILIGDWRFVKGHDSPGMRALARLEDHESFEVVSFADA